MAETTEPTSTEGTSFLADDFNFSIRSESSAFDNFDKKLEDKKKTSSSSSSDDENDNKTVTDNNGSLNPDILESLDKEFYDTLSKEKKVETKEDEIDKKEINPLTNIEKKNL